MEGTKVAMARVKERGRGASQRSISGSRVIISLWLKAVGGGLSGSPGSTMQE